MIRIWGDFMQRDSQGRVILPHADDVKDSQEPLREGLEVIVYDDEVEARAILEYDDDLWRARLIANTGRYYREPRSVDG